MIVIRADARSDQGLGHVMRCLALAERYAADRGPVTFAGDGVPPAIAARMAAAGIELVPAPADAAALAGLALHRGAGWVVLDGYLFGPGYEALVVASGVPVLVIDDDGLLGGEGATLVLNQGPDASPALYPGRDADTLLLGPRYRLLREEFHRARRPAARARADGLRVLVSMGGADVAGLSTLAVEALDSAGPAIGEGVILLGPLAEGADAVREAAARARTSVTVVEAPADAAAVMAGCDLALVAAGGSASELAFLGVPTVLVSTAPNQVGIASALDRENVGVDAGWHEDVTAERLGRALASLAADAGRRTAMAERGRRLVDGRGAERVVARLVTGQQPRHGRSRPAPAPAAILIDGRPIGPGEPPYVIAEVSANHRGSRDEAERIVRAAAAAGADAVKLQTYTPDTITIASDAEAFRVRGTMWAGRTLHELYAEGSMPWDWYPHLAGVAAELGVHLFSTAFDPTAIEFLERHDPPAHKVASFELVDLPLIRLLAATGRPLIMSTGMATFDEIEEAVGAARDAGARQLALLHTNSGYPADPDEMQLATIPHLAAAFGVPVGLSDHTLGTATAVAAVALGASIVEKHVTLSRADGGLDAPFSLEPDELAALVRDVRVAQRSVGRVAYGPTPRERASRGLRRSLFVVEDVRAGEPFTTANVRSIRPADGLHTRHLEAVLGRRAAVDVPRGTPLGWDLVV